MDEAPSEPGSEGDVASPELVASTRPSHRRRADARTPTQEAMVRLRPDRRRAVVVAVQQWSARGWPAQWTTRDARLVQHHLEGYVSLHFPDQFVLEERTSIVVVATKVFLAEVHGGGSRAAGATADDLLSAIVDEALDRIRSGDALRPSLRSRAVTNGSRDHEIVWEVFGSHVSRRAVLDALAVVFAQRAVLEFLVVTKYLDLLDHENRRPPLAQVVAELQPAAGRHGLPTITEAEVQSALFRFCNRLPHAD